MNWDNQLSSILSVADGSVAKIRERLTSPGKISKEGQALFPVNESSLDSDLDPGAVSTRAHPFLTSTNLSSGVKWTDLAAIQSQLQIQSQMIESLKWQLHNLEREKQSQKRHIQNLQDEVHCLNEGLMERQTEEMRIRRIKQATSMDKSEDSFNSKLHREELNDLRREFDQLKAWLRRQETDLYLQQKEARETRRLHEHSCKKLEELTECCRTHSDDLVKTLSQYSHTQQELRHIRTEMSELKDEVRALTPRGQEPTSSLCAQPSAAPPLPAPHGHSRAFRANETDSDSEDFSLTLSLAEISSDDLSWLDDKEPAQQVRRRLRVQFTPSEFAVPGSDVVDHVDSDGDDLLDDDDVDNPELGFDLSLNDL